MGKKSQIIHKTFIFLLLPLLWATFTIQIVLGDKYTHLKAKSIRDLEGKNVAGPLLSSDSDSIEDSGSNGPFLLQNPQKIFESNANANSNAISEGQKRRHKNFMGDSTDVLQQAFRFVNFDSHLNALLNQLERIEETHQNLQNLTIKQEIKMDLIMKQINFLTGSITSEASRVKDLEQRLHSELNKMNEKLGDAVENFIKSSTSSGILLDLWKESLLQLDTLEGSTNEVMREVKEIKSELNDVGQASVQAIYNIQKSEEAMVSALDSAANRTIYAMRHHQPSTYTTEGSLSVLEKRPSKTLLFGGKMDGKSGTQGPTTTTTTFSPQDSPSNPTTTTRTHVVNCSIQNKNGLPRDCGDILLSGNGESGVYKIYPFVNNQDKAVEVWCAQGWTTIQRRDEFQKTDFYRNWQDYSTGFGSPSNHLWLGLDIISQLTRDGDQELAIDLMDWAGISKSAYYRYFRVANSTDNYRLHVADYEGNSGDSLSYHNGMEFTTKDQDHDTEKNINCAQKYKGGWWYKSCHQSNLNSVYFDGAGGKTDQYAIGLNWYTWKGYYVSLKRTEMRIRKRALSDLTLTTILKDAEKSTNIFTSKELTPKK